MSVLLLTGGTPNNLLLTSGDDLLLEDDSPPAGGSAGPGGSTIHIQWSPTTGPLDDPVWVDISAYVRHGSGVSITRGRSSELDAFQTGTCSFTLDNTSRLFDPSYASGAYFGNLKPLRRFRVMVTYNAVTYPLFVGFIRGWPQEYEVSNSESVVPVTLMDPFGLLAMTNLADGAFTLDSATLGVLDSDRLGGDGSIPEELSGARVERVLDLAGWGVADREVDTGLSTISTDYPSGNTLSYLQQVEASEFGFFYAASNGDLTFLERTARQTVARISTSQTTFDDDGTDSAYSGLAFSYDDENLFNDIRLTGASGSEQAAEDASSISSYFRRTRSETLLNADDSEVAGLALVQLDRYREPVLRCPQLRVRPLHDPSVLMPVVLGRELLDRVTVRRTPQGVGSVIAEDQLVEGITHVFDSKDWTTTFRLSPGFITEWFTLDSATLGVLGEDVLAA